MAPLVTVSGSCIFFCAVLLPVRSLRWILTRSPKSATSKSWRGSGDLEFGISYRAIGFRV